MTVGSLYRLRDIGRLRRIASVLARHGFVDVAERVHVMQALRRIGRIFRRRSAAAEVIPWTRRIRLAAEELGPTFVKLGQMLATRPDLVPMPLVLELRRLHDEVPPFPFEDVRATIEAELRRPLAEVFEWVEEDAVAAASIAQVHRARLKTGEEVVIKVQRPRLQEVIGADLRILLLLAQTIEARVPEMRPFRPVAIVEEFRRSLSREMDFSTELSSMQRFAANFADEPMLHVPHGYPQLSTRRVLVMERIEGAKITDRAALDAMGVDVKAVVDLGMRFTLRSIFEHGFFHADPHPGNFFIRPDASIALLDFGMMGSVEPQRLDEMLTWMVGLLTGDLDMMVGLLLDADLIGDETDVRALRGELRGIVDRYQHAALASIDVSALISEVFDVTVRHHVFLPADLLLVGKAMATMEGIGREAWPDFQPLDAIRPYLTEVYLKRMLDAKKHSQVAVRSLVEGATLLKDAPLDIRRVLRKLRRGELQIVHRSADAPAEIRARHARTNRLILAALLPVFFFGGVWLTGSESALHNAAGLVSLGLAWLFFIGLGISMLGDGR
ncbi:MAG: AarF/ABC1/UbiB kinase family protein [Deltaproteobacteria bacterium]|nr:AarF/ABC1/UbiB kinase family protein [Deltaproteobacteria bacterium]